MKRSPTSPAVHGLKRDKHYQNPLASTYWPFVSPTVVINIPAESEVLDRASSFPSPHDSPWYGRSFRESFSCWCTFSSPAPHLQTVNLLWLSFHVPCADPACPSSTVFSHVDPHALRLSYAGSGNICRWWSVWLSHLWELGRCSLYHCEVWLSQNHCCFDSP